jgi:hypothetical protein
MTTPAETATDAPARHVGVKQQAQPSLLPEPKEGVELAKLVKRAGVGVKERRDLVRKALGVRARKREVRLTHQGMGLRERRRIIAVGIGQVDELPDIEAAPNHPGTPGVVAKGDAGEEPGLCSLLRKLLDEGASAAPGAPRLLPDE